MATERANYRVKRLAAALSIAAGACALLAPAASARWFGSTMAGPANAPYGCETALTMAPLGGTQLSPTGQTSCTYRHGGYLFSNRATFLAPRTGRVTKIRVKSGPNPALLRPTVLTGSSRVNTFTGQDLPGTYTCCTAEFVGRAFRPRPNAITTRRVRIKVFNIIEKDINIRIHSSDGLALSAVGPGTVPLSIGPNPGGFESGTPIATGYWPRTKKGDPRVDGYSMTGIDLLFQWKFKPGLRR